VKPATVDLSIWKARCDGVELQDMNEGSLLPSDIKNAALSLYRERRKYMPALHKSRSEAQDAIQSLSLETNVIGFLEISPDCFLTRTRSW
jgi:hypothetical protein